MGLELSAAAWRNNCKFDTMTPVPGIHAVDTGIRYDDEVQQMARDATRESSTAGQDGNHCGGTRECTISSLATGLPLGQPQILTITSTSSMQICLEDMSLQSRFNTGQAVKMPAFDLPLIATAAVRMRVLIYQVSRGVTAIPSFQVWRYSSAFRARLNTMKTSSP